MDAVWELLGIATVTAVSWVTPRFARPTVPFGVRVPPGRVDDPVVRAERRRFSRLVLGAGALVAVACAVLAARLPRRRRDRCGGGGRCRCVPAGLAGDPGRQTCW